MENLKKDSSSPISNFSNEIPDKTKGGSTEKITEKNQEAQKIAQEAIPTHIAPDLFKKEDLKEKYNVTEEIEKESIPQKVQEAVTVTLHFNDELPAVKSSLFAHEYLSDSDDDDLFENEAAAIAYTPVDRSKLQQISFDTVTRYLPNCQALLDVQGRDEEVGQLCENLRQSNWSAILEQYKGAQCDDLAKDGLKAFHQGSITMEQFCTLTYCAALLKDFPNAEIHIQPLFRADGTVDPQAQKIVDQSLHRPPSRGAYGLESHSNFFGLDEAKGMSARFFEEMRNKPSSSEKVLFYMTREPLPSQRDLFKMTIQQILEEERGLRIDRFYSEESMNEIIPTFSMIQAYVDAYGQENTVAPIPTIGASTRGDLLRNAQERGRDILIPFPGVACPKTADGFIVTDPFEFILHDIYHCFIVAKVPDLFRKETALIANSIASLQSQHAQDDNFFIVPFLETLYGRMVDMEFGKFQPKWLVDSNQRNIPKEEIFLWELQAQITSVTLERMELKLRSLPSAEQRVGLPPSTLASLEKWDKIRENFGTEITKQFNHFCSSTPIINELARAMCENGFLNRCHISERNLQNMEQIHGKEQPENALLHRNILKSH